MIPLRNSATDFLLVALFLVLLFASRASAQLTTVYVDAFNGSDSYSGANPTNSTPGTGPKATIDAGLREVANNGTLVIFAGPYAGDGIDSDDSPLVSTDNADIEISLAKYPRLTSGLTIELRAQGANNEIRIEAQGNSVRASNGALITHSADQYIPNVILNIPGGTLRITATNGTEFLNLIDHHSSGTPASNLILSAGMMSIGTSSYFRLADGATVTLNGTSRFSDKAPQKGTNLSLNYIGDGTITAGPESNYGNYGAGVLVVAKSAGTSVTFPYAMSFAGFASGSTTTDAITVSSGDAVFNGALTIGNVGSSSVTPTAGDIVISGSSNVIFDSTVALTILGGRSQANADLSSIMNIGTGTVTFHDPVQWNVYYGAAANYEFPVGSGTSLVRNEAAGSVFFASPVIVSAATATLGADSGRISAAIENASIGQISFNAQIDAPIATIVVAGTPYTKLVALSAVNSSTGTLRLAGKLYGALINDSASSGMVVINGPTISGRIVNTLGKSVIFGSNAHATVAGVLRNGGTMNLGSNTLTLSGSVAHETSGGTITAESDGGIIVSAGGSSSFNGGTLSNVIINSGSGVCTLGGGVTSVSSLTVTSGKVVIGVNTNVVGATTVNGGTLRIVDGVIVRTGSFVQSDGSVVLGAGMSGVLRLDRDFNRTSGVFLAGSGSLVSLQGTGAQVFNGGPALQLAHLTVNNAVAPITVAHSVIVSGVLKNGGTMNLGSNTLTLSGSVAHETSGGTITAESDGGIIVSAGGSSSFNGGTLSNVIINSGSGVCTLGGGVTSVSSLTVTSGKVVIGVSTNVVGATTVNGGTLRIVDGVIVRTGSFVEVGGSVQMGGGASGVLQVDGDFNRQSGALVAAHGSLVLLQGTRAQVFSGGPLLQLANLAVNNPVAPITITQSVFASGALTIEAGTNLILGTASIILNGDNASCFNAGSYTSDEGNGIVFGGTTSVSGGRSITGASFTSFGKGVYTNITVDIGGGNWMNVSGVDTRFEGALTLASGSLFIPEGTNFGPVGAAASVIRDVALSAGITFSGGTFNAGGVPFELTYRGTLKGNVATAGEFDASPADVRNWKISVNSEAGVGRVGDNDGDLATGTLFFVELPASGIVFPGNLDVGPLAAVRIAANAVPGNAIELSGDGATYNVRGILATVPTDGDDRIIISGANVTLAGSAATNEAALIGNMHISSRRCTIQNVQGFTGTFRTEPNSVVSVAMGSLNAPPDRVASEQIIAGPLIIGGAAGGTGSNASFSLLTNIEAQAGVQFNSGTLNFGNSNLTTTGNFVQDPAALGYTSITGYLVMNRFGANLVIANTPAKALPNLRILAPTRLAAAGLVSGSLQIGIATASMPTLILGSNDLTFTGSIILLLSNSAEGTSAIIGGGNTDGTNDGDLVVRSSTATIVENGSYAIEELTYDPPGGSGTLTFTTTSMVPQVFSVSDMLTHVGGELALGINHLALTGGGNQPRTYAYNRRAGTITSSRGEVRFTGTGRQMFECGTDATLSIPNLTISNPSGVANAIPDQPFVVTGTLRLIDGTLTTDAGTLTLGADVTIVRKLGSLSSVPKFGTSVNVSYVGGGNMTAGVELPSSPTTLYNLTIDPGPESTVTLSKNVTVNGTLFLSSGTLDRTTSFSIGMEAGTTIDRAGGVFFPGRAPILATYNLVYSTGTSVTSTNDEFPSAGSRVLSLSVTGAGTLLTLDDSKMVGDLRLAAARGGIVLGTRNAVRILSITGNATITEGSFVSLPLTVSVSSLPTLAFEGSAQETLTVPAAGLILSNGVDANSNGVFTDNGDSPPIDIQIQNRAQNKQARSLTLSGGSLVMGTGGTVRLESGVVYTGTNTWTLVQGKNLVTNQPTQGFDRSSIATGDFSHFVGNVKKFIHNSAGVSTESSTVIFPVGTGPAPNAFYRPLTLFFKSVPQSSFTVTVNHVNDRPGGAQGFPLPGPVLPLANYADLYWFVKSDVDLPQSFQYDLETQAEGYSDYTSDQIQNVRIVRRDSGSVNNPWSVFGANVNYQNTTLATDWPVVKVVNVSGGLLSSGSLFAYSRLNKPPRFTAALSDLTVNEGDTLTFRYVGADDDFNQKVSLRALTLPAAASFNPTTGEFNWVIDYKSGTLQYAIGIRADDGLLTSRSARDTIATITVLNVNRKPVFTRMLPDTTIRETKDTLKFVYQAVDPDGDPLTYSLIGGPQGLTVTSSGALNWIPTFSQAGQSYVVRVRVTDGIASDSMSVRITVIRSRIRGDVSGDGAVTAFDAALVLQHVTGIITLTDPFDLFAADASANGMITAFDAALILQVSLGLIGPLP